MCAICVDKLKKADCFLIAQIKFAQKMFYDKTSIK